MKKTYQMPVMEMNAVSMTDVIATSLSTIDVPSRVNDRDVYDFADRFGR